MTTYVTIKFKVEDENYDNYEEVLDEFLNNLNIDEVDVREKENEDEDEDYDYLIEKQVSCEIDSEFFFDNISMDMTEWSYDLDDLKDNEVVYEHIKEYYPQELALLEEGKVKYLSCYKDC